MRIKIFSKKLISISVATIFVATLTGCFDLGDFSDEAEYYESFGDVKMVYQNPESEKKDIESKDYSIQDYFYNKNTGKDFTYGDPKDDKPDTEKNFPQLPYVYMAIPVEKNLTVESVALYFNGTQTCSLEVFFYVVDSFDFSNIWLWGEPEYSQTQENGETIYEKIKYSDPSDSLIVAKTTSQMKEGVWGSMIASNWNQGKTLELKDGQYILLRFINNSGACKEGTLPVSFRVTNLLIRAFF